MPGKRRILKDLEKSVKNQKKEEDELEDSERFTRKRLDPVRAPAVDTMEEMKKKWKYQEKSRELVEEGSFTNEGDVESEEESGEEPYPEIEEYMKKEIDEEEED